MKVGREHCQNYQRPLLGRLNGFGVDSFERPDLCDAIILQKFGQQALQDSDKRIMVLSSKHPPDKAYIYI